MNLKIVVIVRKEVIKMKEEKQEKLVGEGVGFDRIRRITGYLVGTLDRFNDAKRDEVESRVKHMKADINEH